MNETRQTTDDGQVTNNELAGGASVGPGTDRPFGVTSSETHEWTREKWVEYGSEDDVKLSVPDLDVYYSDDHALNGVSMEIPEDSVMALIGPSGYGKSTLLRYLNRMSDRIRATHVDGSVRFEGEEIYQEGISLMKLRKRVGMVFRSPNSLLKNIAGNIPYEPRKHGNPDTDLLANLFSRSDDGTVDGLVERSLRQAVLWSEVRNCLDDNAFGLPGGQQQWLCTARASATDPEVLLMDEPALALDLITTLRIEDLVHGPAEEYTVVVATHNMQQAMHISDQTAVFLTGGKLVEYGDADQILEDPQGQRIKDYISSKFR